MNNLVLAFIIITLLGLFFQKSKILTIIVFFFIWTLAWTTEVPDYDNYLIRYDYEIVKDYGYFIISLFFKKLGLTYFQFRLTLLAIGWSIYVWFIIKFSKRCSLVSVLYMCTVSLFDIVQNRNFFGFTLCLLGLGILTLSPTKRSQILYILLILIATSIHSTCCFFIIFLFLNKSVIHYFSKLQLILIGILIISITYIYFSNNITETIDSYNQGVSFFTQLLLMSLFIFNLLFIYFTLHFKTPPIYLRSLSKAQYKYSFNPSQNIYLYNIGLFILLPAAFMSLSALRFFRYMEIINLCFVSDRLTKHRLIKNIYYSSLIVLYSISYLLVTYLMHSTSFLLVILPPFYDNIFYY